MTTEKLTKKLEVILEKYREKFNKGEMEAMQFLWDRYHPTCGNCKFHKYFGDMKRGKVNMKSYRCTNPNSEYRRTYVATFITCTSWVSRDDEEDKTEPIAIGIGHTPERRILKEVGYESIEEQVKDMAALKFNSDVDHGRSGSEH